MSPRFPTPPEVVVATATWKQRVVNVNNEVKLINDIVAFLRSRLNQEASVESLRDYLRTLELNYSEYTLKERMVHLPWKQYFRIHYKRIEMFTGDYSLQAMVQLVAREVVTAKQQAEWIERLDPLADVPDVKQYPPIPLTRLKSATRMFKLDKETTKIITDDVIKNWKALRLSKEDVKVREQIASTIQQGLRQYERYDDCKVVIFGSSVNGLASSNGDLDMNLESDEINHVLTFAQDQLRRAYIRSHIDRLANYIRRLGYIHVESISRARVPLVKFVDPKSNIACDLTITNKIARRKTLLLEAYTKADPRVRPLLFAVKRWIKARKIGDATEQGGSTVNSYTHSLMVIAFLQWVKVVPMLQYVCCFGEAATRDQIRAYNPTNEEIEDQLVTQLNELSINDDNANDTTANVHLAYGKGQACKTDKLEHNCLVCGKALPSHMVEGFQTYFYTGVVPPSPNKQSVAHLLIEFFRFYAITFKNKDHCVSPRMGGLILRSGKYWGSRLGFTARRRNGDLPAFCVEDPFETEHNCALSAYSSFWPGLRWEYERAMRTLLFDRDTTELYRKWREWPAAAYGALGIW
ncbi:hypothetical protein BDF22DRAFT_694442 [Syncephalis plumigaleata]|nr:hypothetical protein BDF22DRAFT_694442 [Syncephalis plumigaleata]